MASLTVRNIPDGAKLRFRQIAAAHGRSMEEHLRQLVIEADLAVAVPAESHVSETRHTFKHGQPGVDIVNELIRIADGAGAGVNDARKYVEIRFMTAKDAMAELRRLANGASLDLPPRMNSRLDAPEF